MVIKILSRLYFRGIRCQYLVGTLVEGSRCASSWCDLNFT